jgi:copper chaperone CopZ
MKKLSLHVQGMHCKSCKVLITDELEETGFVSNIHVDVEGGIVSCEYDLEKITAQKIKEIVEGEGYKVI